MADMLGDRIEQARKDAGLTREKLARQIGVNWRTLARYERGENANGVNMKTLTKISQATGKPLEYFVTEVAA